VAQGTIKTYDDATHTGALLMDDRTEVSIDDRSVGDDQIRTLRIGQRVRFDLTEEAGRPTARGLRLVTFE
jgi:cold shock CspA family protein